MLTNDNIVNFITDLTFVIMEAQEELEAGRMPESFTDFVTGTCVRFDEEEESDDLLGFEGIIEDYGFEKELLVENKLIYNEWELMKKCVTGKMNFSWQGSKTCFDLLDLGRPSDEYIIRVIIEGDFYELIFSFGDANGYEYAQKFLDRIWRSAGENRLMFEFDGGALNVYADEG